MIVVFTIQRNKKKPKLKNHIIKNKTCISSSENITCAFARK